MTTPSLVRKRQDKAAVFVEQKSETVVVTVDADRIELSATEWDSLPPWEGEVPTDFNKPPRQAA